MLKSVIITASLGLSSIAAAEPHLLSGPEIKDLVGGSTVEIDTPLGTKLPIRHFVDGQLSGEASSLAFYLGAPADTGRWWVTADQLCQKWTRWFNAVPQCMQLRKQGRTIHWRNQDGKSGTATLTGRPPFQVARTVPRAQPDVMRLTPDPITVAPPAAASPPLRIQSWPTSVEAPTLANKPTNPSPPPAKTPVAKPPSEAPTEKPPAKKAVAQTAPAAAPSSKTSTTPAKSPVRSKPEPVVQPAFAVTNVDPGDVLNVRSGPSADFDVIGELTPGSRGITITGECQLLWCPVQQHATSGWVNRMYLASMETQHAVPAAGNAARDEISAANPARARTAAAIPDNPDAPRSCLTQNARALLDRIEQAFGPVKLVSTCRSGAIIRGTNRPSLHGSGNAFDLDAGSRRAAVIAWLIANHHAGGTMTYAELDHIHVDIGPHFVSVSGGPHWASWRDSKNDFPVSMGLRSGG